MSGGLVADGCDEKPFNAMLNEIRYVVPFQPQVALRIAEQEPIASLASGGFSTADDWPEEWIRDIRDDHADELGLLRREATGHFAGRVVELGDCGFYLLSGLGGNARLVVDDARNRHRGNAGLARYIPNRRCHICRAAPLFVTSSGL